MELVLPVPEVQIGPDWAEEIVAAFNRVDLHDHSDALGVKITPAGLDITSDLDIQGNNLLNVLTAELSNNGSSPSSLGSLYRIGNNLWYNNASGFPIQITTGTTVNAPGSGVISADSPASYPYTVISGDAQKVLLIDTNAARTINLPAATTAMFFMIKDQDGLAQTNPITIDADGTDVIDGAGTFVLDWNYGAVGLVSDGVSAWYLV